MWPFPQMDSFFSCERYVSEKSMETKALIMLQLMLDHTKQGKIRWTREDDAGRFEASVSGQTFTVEFIYFLRTDEVGSDRTMARIGAFNLYDYCIGTEGFDLICEMLSIDDPEWAEARERRQKRFDDGMVFLQQLNVD